MAARPDQAGRRRAPTRGAVTLAAAAAVLVAACACAYIWRGELWRATLDPKQPYPTYRPPPAPDYASASAWALRPADAAYPAAHDPPADVFFLHATTYAGGRDWNAPIHDRPGADFLQRVVLPNYAGPFQRVGRVWAPRYRAASLFAYLTLRDDARDARRFAYRDVRSAFDAMLAQSPQDRPLVLAGVGQGANLMVRLLQDRVLRDPRLRRRVAAVYLMDEVVAADALPVSGALSPCRTRDEGGCTLAWAMAPAADPEQGARRLARALVWTPDGALANLGPRPALCVNPLTGGTDQPAATAKANLGAANATGLEWGMRPAFLAHEVSARCEGGLLRVSAPLAASLQLTGGWVARRRIADFNLFYADIEADAGARVQAFAGRQPSGTPAPPITATQAVERRPVHGID